MFPRHRNFGDFGLGSRRPGGLPRDLQRFHPASLSQSQGQRGRRQLPVGRFHHFDQLYNRRFDAECFRCLCCQRHGSRRHVGLRGHRCHDVGAAASVQCAGNRNCFHQHQSRVGSFARPGAHCPLWNFRLGRRFVSNHWIRDEFHQHEVPRLPALPPAPMRNGPLLLTMRGAMSPVTLPAFMRSIPCRNRRPWPPSPLHNLLLVASSLRFRPARCRPPWSRQPPIQGIQHRGRPLPPTSPGMRLYSRTPTPASSRRVSTGWSARDSRVCLNCILGWRNRRVFNPGAF